MITFNTAPDIILDLIFLKLSEEDLHETLHVSKAWFWASIRRMKKLKIDLQYNPLKSMADFYNHHRPAREDPIYWCDLFRHLVLDELIVIGSPETINYLMNNGCNTVELTIKTTHYAQVTLASLKRVTRLQFFEYRTYGENDWHPFIAECLKKSDCEFDPNNECPIKEIKLNSCGWSNKDRVLQSVTKLSVWHVTIEFLRTMLDHCPNLEELHCSFGTITEDWHQVFPVNVKRIEFLDFDVDSNVSTIVNASTDAARHLLPYLCQDCESIEKFNFDGYTDSSGRIVYEAFPQQREEVFMGRYNNEMNLASPLFQSREISVHCHGWHASRLNIPPAKSVKLEFYGEADFKFSPRAVCFEPGKVEHLALLLQHRKEFTPEPFGPNSFEGFSHLTSLTLSCVSAAAIKLALYQCPSIKKLKLKDLEAMTIGNIAGESSYANVCELLLGKCEEPVDRVFQVFPCLSEFKHSVCRKYDMSQKTDWLGQHLIGKDKRYGFVFQRTDEIRYIVSDDLHTTLNQSQKLLNELLPCECFLKGFKLIPRVSKQKLIYLN